MRLILGTLKQVSNPNLSQYWLSYSQNTSPDTSLFQGITWLCSEMQLRMYNQWYPSSGTDMSHATCNLCLFGRIHFQKRKLLKFFQKMRTISSIPKVVSQPHLEQYSPSYLQNTCPDTSLFQETTQLYPWTSLMAHYQSAFSLSSSCSLNVTRPYQSQSPSKLCPPSCFSSLAWGVTVCTLISYFLPGTPDAHMAWNHRICLCNLGITSHELMWALPSF